MTSPDSLAGSAGGGGGGGGGGRTGLPLEELDAPDLMPRLPDLWRSSHHEKPNATGWQQRSAPLQQRPTTKDGE